MPQINGTRPAEAPHSRGSRRHCKFLSPDKRWSVTYHTRREWHMGADGWRVRLLRRGIWMGWQHRGLSSLAGAKGFRCEEDLQPWSRDSQTLALITWDDDPVYLYDVATRSLRNAPRGPGFVYSTQWSSALDRLLVVSESRGVLADHNGVQRGSVEWNIAPGERPHTYWTRDGAWFFVVGRESLGKKTRLTFHAGVDGSSGDAVDLDPLDLVPYDAERFAQLPRDRFCLAVTPSMGAVGSMLDTWHGFHFDRTSGTLYLAVYRPVSLLDRAGDESWCRVEERWIAVELGD